MVIIYLICSTLAGWLLFLLILSSVYGKARNYRSKRYTKRNR